MQACLHKQLSKHPSQKPDCLSEHTERTVVVLDPALRTDFYVHRTQLAILIPLLCPSLCPPARRLPQQVYTYVYTLVYS